MDGAGRMYRWHDGPSRFPLAQKTIKVSHGPYVPKELEESDWREAAWGRME